MIPSRSLLGVGQYAAMIAVLSGAALAQAPALRVVVIEGEDAVNIIQQKTAVRPVVEVRDRNNLPVAGALVTFSIEGGTAASFGGASTLTVATNAAGQAAVTGLTPSAAGAFQIQVSAAFQGQVATATIAQTNVMTAAQAAAASGATGGGSAGSAGGAGAAGSGGGMSTTTLSIVGAAAAGGALVATQAGGKEEAPAVTAAPPAPEEFTGTLSGTSTSTVSRRDIAVSCTHTSRLSAPIRIVLEVNRPDSVRGVLTFSGQTMTDPSPCVQVPVSGTFAGTTDLSGTPASIQGSRPNTGPTTLPGGEQSSGTTVTSFTGVLTGTVITGTVKIEQRVTTTSTAGLTTDSSVDAVIPVTLNKTP